MKIKLAVLDNDAGYLKRFVDTFTTKYAEKIELYSFSDFDIACEEIEKNRINVFIASDYFQVDVNKLPKNCSFAYFVGSPDVDSIDNQKTVCKFQKIDEIYKQVIGLYSENAGNISDMKLGDEKTKIVAFSSPSGGVGCSTLAASCALHFAARGKKTLYLNLEKFGSADKFFVGVGQSDMSDLIYALKSKKVNFTLKLESIAKFDERGVYFFSEAKNAIDMMELTSEEIKNLIFQLKMTGLYEFIVLDMDFSISKDMLDLYTKSHALIVAGDGSDISNGKLLKAYEAIATIEANSDMSLLNRMLLIYNKFSSKTSNIIEGIELKNIGGVPKIEHATTQQILKHISEMAMFDKIYE